MSDLLDRFANTLDPEDAAALADVRRYAAWQASQRGDFEPGANDDVDLRTYLLELRTADNGSGAADLCRTVASLQRFYEWAQAEGKIPTTPFVEYHIDRPTLSRDRIRRREEGQRSGPQQEISRLRALNHLTAVLNRSADVRTAIEATLDTLLEVMELRTAWISLRKGTGFARYADELASSPTYLLAAARGLPPGLEQDGYCHLRSSPECRCQSLLSAGRLNHAVNVVECTRLRRAADAEGDTQGLRFHASVPILSQDQPLGVLNAATDDWQFLSASDLQLLTAAGLQIAAALERARLYEMAQAQSTRMARELDLARIVQASLLPQQLPDTPGFGIAADWCAAREMAGDFYDVFPLAGGRTGIVVADVLDKGAPAALYMVLVRSLIRAQVERTSSPAEVLTQVNRQLVAQSSADMFVTVFLGILDPSTCALTYASAGHPPPLLRRAAAQGEPEPLARGGPLLGVFEEVELIDAVSNFSPGDLLVAYTDGLTEARNPDVGMFGEERLIDLVRAHAQSSAQALVETLMAAAAAFAQGAPQADDITVVVVRCQPD